MCHYSTSKRRTSLGLLLLLFFAAHSISAFVAFPTRRTQRYLPNKQAISLTRTRPTLTTSLLQASASTMPLSSSSFFLARMVFLRALALVYSVAFLVAFHQNKALIGDDGITPARRVLDQAEKRGRLKRQDRQEWAQTYSHTWGRWKRFWNCNPKIQAVRELTWDRADRLDRPITTLLWLAQDRSHLNRWLDGIALAGILMAFLIMWGGTANVPLLFGLWVAQRSIMAVGGPWYGYGWEPQLAELGFYSLFLVPLLSLHPTQFQPPLPVIYTIRWYLFKIMMGAGLIKFKSRDRKWKDLSAMDSFYETQPVPNPFSRYLHWLSPHKFEVLVNHFVEVVAPFLLLIPFKTARRAGGLIQIGFQTALILSGNLSFLNWLTMVPAFLCLDDAFLAPFFSPLVVASVTSAAPKPATLVRKIVTFSFVALIATLSIPVVKNLLAKRQLMNASFDPLRLVNTYGAFGTVNDFRNELIVKSAQDVAGPWKEYEFKVKPGDVMRHARWISPYHYRLDWQMWIAATIGSIDRSPWIYSFLLKLLERNEGVVGLIESDPWQNAEEPPKYIRIDVYRYHFHKPVLLGKGKQPYWDRELVGRFYPRQGIATIASLKDEIKRL